MSFQAMAWAMSLEMSKSTEKFVFVCMANYADEDGNCYPSIDRLVRDTNQDRKTIIKNLKSLIAQGLLRDTGRRVGATASVVVYQLCGAPEQSQVHYVYKLRDPDTGRYYYGKRSCNCDPAADTYRGSGKWPRECVEAGVFLEREVIGVYQTSAEALAAESAILRGIGDDELCMNSERPHAKRVAYAQSNPNIGTHTENGTAKRSQYSAQAVPKTDDSSTKNGTQNLLGKNQEPVKSGEAKFDYQTTLDQCLKAAGLDGFRQERNTSLANLAPILGLIRADWSLDDEILPAIQAKAAAGFVFRSWSLVPDIVAEFRAKFAKGASTPRPTRKEIDWAERLEYFQTSEQWPASWGPKPGENGCKVPASLLQRVAA